MLRAVGQQMRTRKIENYLDTGSLTLFSRQILQALDNSVSVAIHDAAGQLVWAGPDEENRTDWSVSPFLREPIPGIGYCERLSNSNFVYVFYLGDTDVDRSMGTVSIQVAASHPTSLERAHAEIAAIVRCIERQMAINSELSSIRRISKEGQRGLELLVQLDELDEDQDPSGQIRRMLDLAATHFNADMTAALLPELKIREALPATLMHDAGTSKAVMTMLGSLFTTTKTHRKVLLSDANISNRSIAGLPGADPKVLCCPIMNAKDEVIGIFVLVGETSFGRDDVRLARAISVKIATAVKSASQSDQLPYTRHTLVDYIDNALQREPEQRHSLLFIDIDKLHVVNDSYGHVAGDRIIEHVQNVILELANRDDAVSHLSGDCFGLFLRGADEGTAIARAKLILDTLARGHVSFETVKMQTSASIGIVEVPGVATNGSAALNTAEMAAKSAKGRGGKRCVVFQDADASVAQRRTDLEQINDLQYALIQNRFVLHAQPIVPLQADDGPARYEILIRMLDDNDRINPSAAFIAGAERYQMMSAIDRWVIKSTLDALAAADNMIEVNLSRFSINVSAQSIADDDFFDYIETCISESGVSPDSLCFEITETAIVRNLARAQQFIRRLRKLGCMVALDDFGTGYCSFAYLKDLPVNYVKIDGVFVRDVLQNPLSEAIVSSMVGIAKVMKAATVAEHVENELIYQQMRKCGIDYAQGFAIGRPKPLSEVLSRLGETIMLDMSADSSSAMA